MLKCLIIIIIIIIPTIIRQAGYAMNVSYVYLL